MLINEILSFSEISFGLGKSLVKTDGPLDFLEDVLGVVHLFELALEFLRVLVMSIKLFDELFVSRDNLGDDFINFEDLTLKMADFFLFHILDFADLGQVVLV